MAESIMHLLWNVMAVIGILFSASCVFLLIALVLSNINDADRKDE